MACRVAALVLLLALAVAPPPCAAAARVRLLADVPRATREAPGYDKTDGSAAAGSGFQGSPPEFDGKMAAVGNAAARVMGSVPSPGVGH